MNERGPARLPEYLEVTFRHGRAIAACLYLGREPGEKSSLGRHRGTGR